MIIAKVLVGGIFAEAACRNTIPAGIIGAQVEFEYTDPAWDGLSKTVVFRGSVTKDVLGAGNTVVIPPEVVAEKGARLSVGIYGVDGENNVAIPTLWADLGVVRDAANPSGDETTDPSLPAWAQLEQNMKTKVKEAVIAGLEEAKESGEFEVDEETVEQIVDKYLDENPPTAVANLTINGQAADENGNFVINTVSDVEIARLAAALT